MAKKGGVQQLQADINTDEEFDKFLERQGLLVLDVYSEWCGPCLGMVGSLKKIKLELGGDNLHLAVSFKGTLTRNTFHPHEFDMFLNFFQCKSDTISYLKRFSKKSEPTWLFVTGGKAVNLMFGTNVPKLMRTIAKELELLSSKEPRRYYEITELQPEEQERQRIKEEAKAEAERIEYLEREKQRKDYLMSVTDIIMENLPDFGVTIFGPQVNRDMFKKIMEPADVLKIQCKDRRVVPVTLEHFETINFACSNPLSPDVIEQIDKKELLICFWKTPDEQNVSEVLKAFANELTKTRIESSNGNEVESPPIISSLELEVTYELSDGKQISEKVENSTSPDNIDLCEYDRFDEKLEKVDVEQPLPETDDIHLDLNSETQKEDEPSEDMEEDKKSEKIIEDVPTKRTETKIVRIPPIWTPNDQRTHAALIYVFFRPQTSAFLPPDPDPEPPHIVMAFDAYKKKDLIDLAERLKDDVPLYGFFTSDIPGEAKFIANSVAKYTQHPHQPTDKLVLKVNKTTTDAMLALAVYGPSYVSANTVVGKQEALKFFPVGYKTAEQELLEAQETAAQLFKKKRKSKKGARVEGDNDITQPENTAANDSAEGAAIAGEEGVSTSGEDSIESEEDEECEHGEDPTIEASPSGIS